MKTTLLHFLFLAASAIFLASCGDKKGEGAGSGGSAPVSEQDALKGLEKEMAEMKAMKKAGKKSDPVARMTMFKPMLAKIKAVKTEGLPPDVKGAWDELKGKISGLGALFKDVPDKKEEIAAWGRAKFTDPETLAEMQKLGTEGKAAGEKLKELGKKYKVDLDPGD